MTWTCSHPIKGWFALVLVTGDSTGKYQLGTYIKLLVNLSNNVKRDCFLCFSSVCQFKVVNISVTLSLQFLLHGLFSTKRAERCCNISNLRIDVCWYGSRAHAWLWSFALFFLHDFFLWGILCILGYTSTSFSATHPPLPKIKSPPPPWE